MIKFYTKIRKSNLNFDYTDELRKIKLKHGSNSNDWVLNPIDLCDLHSNTQIEKCNVCNQYGHTDQYCMEEFKEVVCIMCGMKGHTFHNCDRKLCFSCGTWQKEFTDCCDTCILMSEIQCNLCYTLGHDSNYCTESWRQFHNIISTETEGLIYY